MSTELARNKEQAASEHPGWRELAFSLKRLLKNPLTIIVTNVKEKTLMVKIADNVKVEMTKSAVSTVVPRGGDSSGGEGSDLK